MNVCPNCGAVANPAPPLTRVERDALLVIQEMMAVNDIGPSYQELADELGFASKSNVHRIVNELEARGYIRRVPGRPRGIEVLRTIPVPPDWRALEHAVEAERAA